MKGNNIMAKHTNNQSGAVSLFVVIFSALLITVVTVSFMRIMMTSQKQATDTDLSQSAYDSALAGVEDGKRAILKYFEVCNPDPTSTVCLNLAATMNNTCTSAVDTLTGINLTAEEVKLQTSSSDADLDQAYTCVKINIDTPDYLGVLEKDASKLISLKSVGDFNAIRLSWFSAKDISSGATAADIPNFIDITPLISQSGWGNRPSIMRAQLIQYNKTNFLLSDFDNDIGGQSNASTLFLYPSSAPEATEFPDSGRRIASISPKRVGCKADFSYGGYACMTELSVPEPIAGSASTREAYLYLTSLYNGSNFKIELLNSGTIVNFKQVQPEIDSTGRANDLFRRVKSRVEPVDAAFPYPEAAVDLENDLCKNFAVNTSTYIKLGNCEP